MGAQDEYLRNFCILLTDKGIIPLTDPLQIAVYKSLKNGMKRPSDLTSELGLSSSSLHFIIDKMADSGIVDRIKPETDKKTVYYSTSAIVLARSEETDDRARCASQKTFEDPLRNYSGLSSLANMLDCYVSEIGLDVSPIKRKYAEDLADSIPSKKANLEDAILDVRDIFSRLTGFNFTVFSFSPLTLVVTGDDTIRSKSDMMMHFIIRLVENSTGRTYRIASLEDFNGSETAIKVTMERTEKAQPPYLNSSLHHRDDHRFLVVDLDGNAGLMTSDVQMEIVDAIYERPLCITDIVNRVDSPRSTITSNLLRMVEEGVISVFYAESGAAYYGLACSILAKRSRPISADNEDIRNTLDAAKDKEGGFMEGLLLYTMACLKKFGFDSEYIMVVLGAKYMRAMGSADTKGNFDTYFGQMSDIAQTIGLSLSIVSVYPLTIGISGSDPASGMAQAMTFIKGMAHQGLEMASSGIFVRSVEEENISFKEIYPALSMTPVKGVKVENLAAPAAKKRTSSVKTALLNRSQKTDGKPLRTVRYITAAVFLIMLTGILVFSITDSGTDVEAGTVSLTVDDGLGISVYDVDGHELTYPYDVRSGSVLTLSVSEAVDMGYVHDGIAYLLQPSEDGSYSITMTSDLHIERLFDISDKELLNCSFSLFSSSKPISDDSSVRFIDSEEYEKRSEGLYVPANNKIRVFADYGYYIESASAAETDRLLSEYTCTSLNFSELEVKEMPQETKVIDLGKESYYFGDQIVSGQIQLEKGVTSIQLRLVGDRNVDIYADGVPVQLDYDNCFSLDVPPAGDIKLVCEDRDLY